jgi:hypothetical protein
MTSQSISLCRKYPHCRPGSGVSPGCSFICLTASSDSSILPTGFLWPLFYHEKVSAVALASCCFEAAVVQKLRFLNNSILDGQEKQTNNGKQGGLLSIFLFSVL